jgi:hypothetical protein
MKLIYLTLLTLLAAFGATAGNGGTKAAAKASAAKVSMNGSVKMKFTNIAQADSTTQKDSVLIIFDRCDRTGAGIVYHVFYADNDQNITIPEVPAGKYFVTIQCLGLHHERMEKVVTVKSQKDEQVKIALNSIEEFSKDKVVIPTQPNPQDFASYKSK